MGTPPWTPHTCPASTESSSSRTSILPDRGLQSCRPREGKGFAAGLPLVAQGTECFGGTVDGGIVVREGRRLGHAPHLPHTGVRRRAVVFDGVVNHARDPLADADVV